MFGFGDGYWRRILAHELLLVGLSGVSDGSRCCVGMGGLSNTTSFPEPLRMHHRPKNRQADGPTACEMWIGGCVFLIVRGC